MTARIGIIAAAKTRRDGPGIENAPEVSLRGVVVSGLRLDQPWARIASSSRATMLVILIIGFTAGPAVSL